jgi:hypothetical protein
MPTYSSALPPASLHPGAIGLSFNNESPAAGTAGAQFAMIEPGGFPSEGRTVTWQTIFGTAPSAVNVSLQAAMHDTDAEYKDIDASTQVNGEERTVANVRARFLRAKMNSITGGGGVTVQVLP